MGSVTSWHRLEGLPSGEDLTPGLRNEIADPAWFLARQRHFGELKGEDAGSPIEVGVRAAAGRISRYHPGRPASRASGKARDYIDATLPLEVLVEREQIRGLPGDGRLVVEAGLHFLRLLKKHKASSRRSAYVNAYPIDPEILSTADPATTSLARSAIGRVPDGNELFGDLLDARGSDSSLARLPTSPDVGGDRDKVIAAANEFLSWWEAHLSEPTEDDDAWESSRLEHSFAVQADLPDGRVVLMSDEYHGGRLDWHHFRATTTPSLGAPSSPVEPATLTRTVLPTPVAYGGMPADRLWEIEDSTVRFGGLSTGRTDLARLLLAEFALTYSNDWFVVPVDLPVGAVCRIDDMVVTDTFGIDTKLSPAAEEGWSMFNVSAPGAPSRVQNLLFLPPVLLETQESDPFEAVTFMRDEMANVVWGIERIAPSDSGQPVDRYEQYQRELAIGERQLVQVDAGDADLIYRLQSFVPDHWHPFVPVKDPQLQLERRPVQRVAADGSVAEVKPQGRILTAADPLRIEEEEVPRAGAQVHRRFQLTRWVDGRTIAWSGRRKRAGRGEGSSGLQYDAARRAGIPGK